VHSVVSAPVPVSCSSLRTGGRCWGSTTVTFRGLDSFGSFLGSLGICQGCGGWDCFALAGGWAVKRRGQGGELQAGGDEG